MKTAFFALLLGLPVSNFSASGFDHTHRLYGKVLKGFVKGGRVQYAALSANPKDLDSYLHELASVQEGDFRKWSQAQKLSYLVNLYNAQTLKLIIDHYPLKSIKDIGSLLKGPWDQPVVRLFGKSITLNHLEHKIIRKDYNEPRSHFVLVCAAMGCPALKEEPYAPMRLETQLEEEGRKFLGARHKNSVDVGKKVVRLSPIFKWFEEDFVKKSGSVRAFVQPYFPMALGGYKIEYTDYDWSLNDQTPKK